VRLSTALVLSGGGLQGYAVTGGLRRLGDVRVLVADMHAENVARFDVDGFHVAPPLADADAFDAFLLRLCREEQVEHLFPITDLDLAPMARCRAALEAQGTQVWLCSEGVIEIARDKLRLAAWLNAQGLPTLPTAATPDELGVDGPVIGKPRAGYGSKGIVEADSRAAARALPEAALGHHAWQPRLAAFEEYSIDFAIAAADCLSPMYARRRVRTSGGYAVLCEPVEEGAVTALAGQVALRLAAQGARGLLNVQLLAEGGRLWVSDLNARAGMSLPLTLAAGGNPVAVLLGRTAPPQRGGTQLRSVRTLQERVFERAPLAGVRGLVFDLDDTLLDQKRWIADKLALLWESLQDELPPRLEFLRQVLAILEEGERARLFDAYVAAHGGGDGLRQRLIAQYRQALPARARLYPDALGTLAQLRQRGFKLGLLTDNPAASQRAKLERAGLLPFFDATVLTGELGHAKPAPQAFDAVASRLGLAPDALVMVGDHLYRDALGALDAGFAHAFVVQRAGAFFNFDLDIAAPCVPAGRLSTLSSLTELHWHLQSACTP
jgi:HAD superfamily hydrolase (TIGR01509 family)